jgi:signal transduction histidine kinase
VDFAALVASAIANVQAWSELEASRVRIITAADEARRRVERDLHDGAQQRIVVLALKAGCLRSLRLHEPLVWTPIFEALRSTSMRCLRNCAQSLRVASCRPV